MFLFCLAFLIARVSSNLQSLQCDKPGIFPAQSATNFIACRYINGQLVSEVLPCPANSEYSVSTGTCILTPSKESLVRHARQLLADSKESGSSSAEDSKEVSDATEDTEEPTVVTTSEKPVEPTKQSSEPTGIPTTPGTTELVTTVSPTTASPTTASPSTASPSTASPTTISPTTEGPKKLVECHYPGVMCTSCSEAALCVGTGSIRDGFPFIAPVTTIQCGPGQVCADLLGCVSDETRLCTLGEFKCTDNGMFPDPYDCRSFHSCSLFNGEYLQSDLKCLGGAYSAATSSCGYPVNSATCINRPVPHCRAEFEMGALPSNNNIYYLCLRKGNTLTPSLFRCPGGRKFTTALFSCV